jgi:hypothetical protein
MDRAEPAVLSSRILRDLSHSLRQAEVPTTAGARLRVAVFIEHDIIYRHFVQSRVFQELAESHEVTFVFPSGANVAKRFSVAVNDQEVGAPHVRLEIDTDRLYQWRRLFQVSQLSWGLGADWSQLRKTMRRMLGPKASTLFTLLGLPGVYSLFRARTLKTIGKLPAGMRGLLQSMQPDVILHPTVLDGLFVNDVVHIGRELRIPTVLIMNSWDNPSTKRTVVGKPDRLLVWGEQTKAHAIKYVGMQPQDVVLFGAAQFEIYRRPPRVDNLAFREQYGIQRDCPILLYAGSSKGSDEVAHLRMIEDAIDGGQLPSVAIIYRPHPWGRGGFQGHRLLDEPWRHVIIDRSMRSYLEAVREKRDRVFLADYADTHDLLANIDVLVSPLSTIILEAMLHGKPALCFLPTTQEGSSLDVQAKLVHFEDMYNDPNVLMAEGEGQLIGSIAALLQMTKDANITERLARSCRRFVEPFDSPYGVRLRTLVEELVDR